jgi:precorrin-6A/cobalt-precorrin-6A reductase
LTTEPAPILVLGGTSEATELSRELAARGHTVVVSFAGRTSAEDLADPPVQRRVGGFGGIRGLVTELQRREYPLLIDATHPFAIRMAQNAEVAARLVGVPHVRLLRPPWEPPPGEPWYEVDNVEQAAKQLETFEARRALLSIGSRHTGAFADINNVELVLRSIEPPASTPEHVTVILARGPFTVDAECALFQEHCIDVLVARNSGGQATQAKLEAARRLGIPVVMIRRPEQPRGEQVSTVSEALNWIEERLPGANGPRDQGSDQSRSLGGEPTRQR